MTVEKKVRCDWCGAQDPKNYVTIYLRDEPNGTPWFGLRADFCEECAEGHSLMMIALKMVPRFAYRNRGENDG